MPARSRRTNLDDSTLKGKGAVGTAGNLGAQPAVKIKPEKDLFTWKAPSRPFKKRSRDFWIKTGTIAAIFGLILLLVEGVMPVVLVISVVFLFYILSTVEPEKIEYAITNYGVKIADGRTSMDKLTKYWFTRRYDNDLLVLRTLNLPGRLELVVNTKDKGKIRKVLSSYLTEEKTPPSTLDRTAKWFSKKLS
jgi:hypothetical protein